MGRKGKKEPASRAPAVRKGGERWWSCSYIAVEPDDSGCSMNDGGEKTVQLWR